MIHQFGVFENFLFLLTATHHTTFPRVPGQVHELMMTLRNIDVKCQIWLKNLGLPRPIDFYVKKPVYLQQQKK